ncbi:unnamed protein product [Rotaria magnacalcarata]|uniref:Uncharacterized protein n=1 Tax=Rotaria magnacalcarata TaxID=392030 RepID=A0A816TV19_9BILA|nr:unnamed protein product [Rotaria magnacalcarata]CAF4390241.1 unnamed protein product [Rotaria magnacalcarata]
MILYELVLNPVSVTTKITSLPYNSSSIRSHPFLAGIVPLHQGGVMWDAALTWQRCYGIFPGVGVRRANINENTHPLSTGHLFASIDDSMQFSEVEESDEEQDDNDNDNHVYSVASNSTNSDDSTSDEEVAD